MTDNEAIEYFYRAMENGSIKSDTQQFAFETAIDALEKQIVPKKPIFDNLYACPTCHTIMLQGSFEARGKRCKECGQLLDWSDCI